MSEYHIKLKYGNPGQYKHNSQTVRVEADSEFVAIQLAEAKFKNSNAAYTNVDVDIVCVEKK